MGENMIEEIMEPITPRPTIILENLRSCYNVGSIIRTADALGRDVVIAGYTPSPFSQPKVAKTSLGAEESVHIEEFVQQVIDGTIPDCTKAISAYKKRGYTVIAAEITDTSVDLDARSEEYHKNLSRDSLLSGSIQNPLSSIAVVV
jgi:23S rRNA (guanosine2251-2'-O)-methyltransferase